MVMVCRMRSVLITGFWATSTMAVSSISYVATRMSGNLSDTMQEHSIASILSVRPSSLSLHLLLLPTEVLSLHYLCTLLSLRMFSKVLWVSHSCTE